MADTVNDIKRRLGELGFSAANSTELDSIASMIAGNTKPFGGDGNNIDNSALLRTAQRFNGVSQAFREAAPNQPYNPSGIAKFVKMYTTMGKDVDPNTLKSGLILKGQDGDPATTINLGLAVGTDPRKISAAAAIGPDQYTTMSQRDRDRVGDAVTGLQRNGMPINADQVNRVLNLYPGQDIPQQNLDRRLGLEKLGYTDAMTSGKMVDRQVDQTWDTKTAVEQANGGKPATQAQIESFKPAATANGTKDVNVPATAAQVGAQNTLTNAASGGNGVGAGSGGPGAPGNLGTTPGSANGATGGQPGAGGYSTGLGQTTGVLAGDFSKSQQDLGQQATAHQMDYLNTMFPDFQGRQANLGQFASKIAGDLNSGAIPEGFMKGFANNIRSAQGVRGLGASPLAAFDEAIGMSQAPLQYQSAQLGLLGGAQSAMGQPLGYIPSSMQGPSYAQVAQTGSGLVNENQNQQQINLGAAGQVLQRGMFQQGLDAGRNTPQTPWWQTLLGGVAQGAAGGLGSAIVGGLGSLFGGGQQTQNGQPMTNMYGGYTGYDANGQYVPPTPQNLGMQRPNTGMQPVQF